MEVFLEVTLECIKAVITAWLLLLVGDFFSTFFYHVPEHVFGKFHSIVHHGKNRSFLHYAVLTKNPLVLFRWHFRRTSLFYIYSLAVAIIGFRYCYWTFIR